ncbi:MAG TPA: hypothetical protein VJN88_13115, partial [Ktedonobacterales bacterium]|nr:hypothetical protein [Ktedonobacterales bacterium]
MQYDFGRNKASTANGAESQADVARAVIEQSRALIANGELKRANDLLVHAIDDSGISEPSIRASLVVMLACLLAAQGRLGEAEERLNPVLPYITDRRSAARIFCARAVELACEGSLDRALEVTACAEGIGSTDHELTNQVDDL